MNINFHTINVPPKIVNGEILLIILIFIIGILLVLYFIWMIIPMISGLPWIPTRPARIHQALTLAHISPGDILYDLGAGDGRVLVMAAREFGARAIGIEISPIHCIAARVNALLKGVNNKVEIRWASFYNDDFKDADVIFVYMTSRETARLRPHLERQLQPGTRVISISCEIAGWQPAEFNREELIYLYRMGSQSIN
jgi:SAM-dependent methyltransferase